MSPVEERIVEFARLLRQAGVRVSPSETADAVGAAALAGAGERASFRASLRATLVKRGADAPVFDRLFELYFSRIGRVVEGLERSLLGDLAESGVLEGDDLEMAARTLSRLAAGLSPLARAALSGDPALLARLLRGAALTLDFSALEAATQLGFYGRRLLAASGGGGLAGELEAVERALREAGIDAARMELVSARLRQALSAVEEAARSYAEIERQARAERRREEAFGRQSLAALSRQEIARAEAAVRRLADRLEDRLARRERSRRRGALDVRRTLRANLSHGGLPMRLAFRAKRRDRPDLVVLCDVSDSVRHVSRLMLLFLYTLQSLFTRVRSFVFVSDLGEVTEAFREEKDVARAADLATAGKVVSLAGNSNYGRALRTFHQRHLGAVTSRTTVLVIGDGRTNYLPPESWVLRDLKRKARRLLWICPEERWAWGSGDSEMLLYAAQVDRVATVTRLSDLEEVADALLPRPGRRG
ncbi:MAG TPA: VWA domain-containing protein [Anaeromyxobacteraceae bacterium]|nr:VWA domain-containing protein [Anaeromyxobacteraceae bacterium]